MIHVKVSSTAFKLQYLYMPISLLIIAKCSVFMISFDSTYEGTEGLNEVQ